MIEAGIVRKIEGHLVWVAAADGAQGKGCASCGLQADCGGCEERPGAHAPLELFGARSGERLFAVRNSGGLALGPGDRVEYQVSEAQTIRAAFLVLVLPVLSFLLCYGLVALIAPGSGEGLRALGGVVGLALGFVSNLLRRRGDSKYPEILRACRRPEEEPRGSC